MIKTLLLLICFLFFHQASYALLDNIVYNNSACGLNFVQKSIKVAFRTDNRIPPPPNRMPVNLKVIELPEPCYQIEKAYIWWSVSFNNATPAQPGVRIVNPKGQTFEFRGIKTTTTDKGPTGWGDIGTRAYRSDVTNAISGNGNYRIAVSTNDYETNGITLFIIYREKNADYEGHIILKDGLYTSPATQVPPEKRYVSDTLSNIDACDSSNIASFFLILSDLQQERSGGINYFINGKPYKAPSLFWNSEVLPASVSKGQDSIVFVVNEATGRDPYSWVMDGLYYQTKSCKDCGTASFSITADKEILCPCGSDNARLTAKGSFRNYVWSNGARGESITVSDTSEYYAVAIDSSGCTIKSNTIKLKKADLSLYTPDTLYKAEPGQVFDIPIVLKNNSCDIKGLMAYFSFDSHILYPQDPTPKGNIINNKRVLAIPGSLIKTDSSQVFAVMHLQATLGDLTATKINLDSIKITDSSNIKDCDFKPVNPKILFQLINLCQQGGTRLVKSDGSSVFIDINPNPIANSALVSAGLIESGWSEIFVMDALGQKVLTIDEGNLNKGINNYNLNISTLSDGTYFIILKTPTVFMTKPVVISR